MVSTSEVSVSLTTGGRPGLERTLARLERLGRVSTETERALLCVVGRQIRSSPGIAARVFGALERSGVNVEMISHGANAINLSMVIRDQAVPEAVRSLHGAFFDEV
jgi:aspartate kinase